MGRTPLQTAVLLALLSTVPALHAETADPATVAAPVETTAATAAATPSAEATAAIASAPAEETPATPADAAANEPVSAAAPTSDPKGDSLALPKEAATPTKKRVTRAPVKVEVDGMPGRGTTMAEVEKHYGKPKKKLAPVGKPPITRWIYEHYTVYFEHQYVIHSVKNEEKSVPSATKPSVPVGQKPSTPANAAASQPPAEPVAPESATPDPQTPAKPSNDASAPTVQEPAGDNTAPKE